MNPTPRIRILAPHEWSTYKELRLRALADSPDAFGRTLADEQDQPDEWWSNRMTPGPDPLWDLPVVAEVDGEPVGLTWGRIEKFNPEVATLYSMWVDARYRGLGAGKMLLDAVIAWAKEKNARYLDLGVTYAESPAMRLYRRAGFKPSGEPVPFRPGLGLLGLSMRLDLGGIPE